MPELIEYKVRPVVRFVVTRYHSSDNMAGSEGKGEFDNFTTARDVGHALCSSEHRALGWELDDPRIQYPKDMTAEECIEAAESDRIEAARRWEEFRNSDAYKSL